MDSNLFVYDESETLKTVIDALKVLPDDSRERILKTILTYFDYGYSGAMQSLLSLSPVSASASSTREPSFGDRSPLSPKDFLHQKSPRTDVERITCLAYYLTNYREMKHFKTEDISALNTEAAQIKLSNPSFTIRNAVQAGLLASAVGTSKQISMHGEKVVIALPDRDKVREVLKAIRRRNSKKRTKKDSVTVDSE